jgi:hypothetical protein
MNFSEISINLQLHNDNNASYENIACDIGEKYNFENIHPFHGLGIDK